MSTVEAPEIPSTLPALAGLLSCLVQLRAEGERVSTDRVVRAIGEEITRIRAGGDPS
jgi:hypothetical protein